jgi:SAM-dependent methyltransferase
MRHENSLGQDYFERIFSDDPDPWRFETSAYEREKYNHTLGSLPKVRFRRALEIGCANGALTERLAQLCDCLIAVDVVEQALVRARRRCADMANVTIRRASIPADRIDGPFDLILLSEVAYYWDSRDLAEAADYFSLSVETGGYLMLVHWIGETDYPKSADEAVSELRDFTKAEFSMIRQERHENYRLDLWRRGQQA